MFQCMEPYRGGVRGRLSDSFRGRDERVRASSGLRWLNCGVSLAAHLLLEEGDYSAVPRHPHEVDVLARREPSPANQRQDVEPGKSTANARWYTRGI